MRYGIARKDECYQTLTYVWTLDGTRWFESAQAAGNAAVAYFTDPDQTDNVDLNDLKKDFTIIKVPNSHAEAGSEWPETADTTVKGRVMWIWWGMYTGAGVAKGTVGAKPTEAVGDYFVPAVGVVDKSDEILF